jgi:hypothetical protein
MTSTSTLTTHNVLSLLLPPCYYHQDKRMTMTKETSQSCLSPPLSTCAKKGENKRGKVLSSHCSLLQSLPMSLSSSSTGSVCYLLPETVLSPDSSSLSLTTAWPARWVVTVCLCGLGCPLSRLMELILSPSVSWSCGISISGSSSVVLI